MNIPCTVLYVFVCVSTYVYIYIYGYTLARWKIECSMMMETMTRTAQTAATAHVGVSCNVLSPTPPAAILSQLVNQLSKRQKVLMREFMVILSYTNIQIMREKSPDAYNRLITLSFAKCLFSAWSSIISNQIIKLYLSRLFTPYLIIINPPITYIYLTYIHA